MSHFQWQDIDQNAGNIIVGYIFDVNATSLTATIKKISGSGFSTLHSNVPIHYHCDNDVLADSGKPLSTIYPDSQDENGALAFQDGDKVIVIYRKVGNKNPMIIGFSNYQRSCAFCQVAGNVVSNCSFDQVIIPSGSIGFDNWVIIGLEYSTITRVVSEHKWGSYSLYVEADNRDELSIIQILSSSINAPINSGMWINPTQSLSAVDKSELYMAEFFYDPWGNLWGYDYLGASYIRWPESYEPIDTVGRLKKYRNWSSIIPNVWSSIEYDYGVDIVPEFNQIRGTGIRVIGLDISFYLDGFWLREVNSVPTGYVF